MTKEFFAKSDIYFGVGAIDSLSSILKEYDAKNIMVIHGKSVKASGIADRVLDEIKKTGAHTVIFDKVIPNPTNEIVEEAALIAKDKAVDAFAAVGGGSAIDLAKAINILMTNPGSIGDYGGMGLVKNEVLPLIAIPTTAGTSSEITNVVALMDTVAVKKYVIIDNKLIPNKVIADPSFTLSMPRSVTASTGLDAITHAVESYISNMATELSQYHSIKALKIFHEYLPKVLEDGKDLEAREKMMLGCIIVGFGFSNANLGLVHAIAHTLSAHFHLAHGVANATVLPYVIEYNAISCPEKMVELSGAIGLKTTGELDKDMYLLSKELLKMTKNAGIGTLSELGIGEKDFDMIADDVLKEPVLGFNPRQGVTKEDVINILKKAL